MAWSKSTRIIIMLVIDFAFFLLELGVGIWVSSLALMADAFHMLNDIISLAVGLWAVKAAQRSKSDKFSFGWLRAEILGAFFNAVFLIALCLSIVLEAIGRLIDPPEISNAVLILIVGGCGLASNLAGFFILGGHAHSHGPDEQSHGHTHDHGDKTRAAEEGHSHEGINGHTHDVADEAGIVGNVFPEAAVARASQASVDPTRHIRFTQADEEASTSKNSDASGGRFSKSSRRHRRRASSLRASRLSNFDDLSIHPASFRQEIIAASRPSLDGIQSEEGSGSEEEAVLDGETPTETSPLMSKALTGNGANHASHDHGHEQPQRRRHDSWHADHNHNNPKKASKSTGHNHSDMGMRAMVLHVIGDALGNVGVIVSALIIWLTDWPGRFYADPAVSLFITLIILRSAIPLTIATAKILLQATPDHLVVEDIKKDIEDIPGIVSCHHVHIWQLSDTQVVASMHIRVSFPISEDGGAERYMEVTSQAKKCLHAYGIHSATIQPEFCLDKTRDNAEIAGLDGSSREDSVERCLLGCVDDCEGSGCCSGPSNVEEQHDHSEHDMHTH